MGVDEMLLTFVGGALYLFAGRQTFWIIMLSDPERNCPASKALEDGTFPKSVYALFILFWPLLLAYGKAQSMTRVCKSLGADHD